MSDDPAGGATSMRKAHKPHMDGLASRALTGRARTLPGHLPAGSDVANLTVLGYDPDVCYTGRSPLEAASLGLTLGEGDWALRCNLVTLSDHERFEDKVMLDYSAGDIPTQEAAELLALVQTVLGDGRLSLHPGSHYRHSLIWRSGEDTGPTTGPHDITDQVIGPYLNPVLLPLMKRGADALKGCHPAANAIWLWGQGTKPELEPFEKKFGLRGAMISDMDLLRGIGRLGGMEVICAPAAGHEAKTYAALEALAAGCDLAYLHFEHPDECGHHGDSEGKVQAIERIDAQCLAILRRELPKLSDHRILVLPDHATPLSTRTHSRDPVPFLLYDSRNAVTGPDRFDEESVAHCEPIHGLDLMGMLLGK
jgi:2,3-bisphosphoglycerate-independent phosphoglycerate mutase